MCATAGVAMLAAAPSAVLSPLTGSAATASALSPA